MTIDKATALAQIDAVLKGRGDLGLVTIPDVQHAIALTSAAITRLALPRSSYTENMNMALNTAHDRGTNQEHLQHIEKRLYGILKALRDDYDAGRLQSFQELVHADLFSDFLEMAEYFLQEGYKDPAAVMVGGVLEEHLRKLCQKHGIAIAARPKLDTMNADLAKAATYGKNDQKQVTAWAGIRNDAAHANYGNYTHDLVRLMVAGVRDFITRNPA